MKERKKERKKERMKEGEKELRKDRKKEKKKEKTNKQTNKTTTTTTTKTAEETAEKAYNGNDANNKATPCMMKHYFLPGAAETGKDLNYLLSAWLQVGWISCGLSSAFT